MLDRPSHDDDRQTPGGGWFDFLRPGGPGRPGGGNNGKPREPEQQLSHPPCKRKPEGYAGLDAECASDEQVAALLDAERTGHCEGAVLIAWPRLSKRRAVRTSTG